MQTRLDQSISIPKWWFILPAYLTIWTVCFSVYSFYDGNGMMATFGIDTGGASDFIMLNSAGRYVSLAIAMVVGIWGFRTFFSILTALLARFTMDIMDLTAGVLTGILSNYEGIIQSILMFLVPNLISIALLVWYFRKTSNSA